MKGIEVDRFDFPDGDGLCANVVLYLKCGLVSETIHQVDSHIVDDGAARRHGGANFIVQQNQVFLVLTLIDLSLERRRLRLPGIHSNEHGIGQAGLWSRASA